MSDKLIEGIVAIATAVIGLALIAVIFGKGSQAGTIITDTGTAFGNVLKAATLQ